MKSRLELEVGLMEEPFLGQNVQLRGTQVVKICTEVSGRSSSS